MTVQPEISICIPAYRNVTFVRRLLDSIAQQTFSNYEIIVSDDSPDDSIARLLPDYAFGEKIIYVKNTPSLGTPANWNAAISHARGKWIKIMHHDDWLNGADALQVFYDATIAHSDASFFFAAFQNVVQDTGRKYIVRCNFFDRVFLKMSLLHLFKRVYVGNPSCTLVRRDANILYDTRFKFVVDFEYYIRFIRTMKHYRYIDKILLNIGFHDEQVTRYTFLVAEVQIPENCLLLEKFGAGILRNPFVYDYYWRMLRNLGVRSLEDIRKHYQGELPSIFVKMLRFQCRFSLQVLRKGVLSKLLMSFSYCLSLFQGVRSR
ncbi:MAG TPA: glycosyltransferase family 2 protein [Chitinophagaceae bacterium]|nr:glycosyltransferase family 2 protein [Chitinophagaceae bacterium]